MSEIDPYAPPYTVGDLAAVAGMPARMIELLIRERVAPEPIGRGRRSAWLYDHRALATMGVAGALYRTALDPVPATRIANAICGELVAQHGYVRDRLDDVIREAGLRAPIPPPDPVTGWTDRYQVHHALVVGLPDYRPAEPMRGDIRAEIVDRAYLYLGVPGMPTLSPWSDLRTDMPAEARIAGWHRGGEVTVRSIAHDIPAAWADGDAAALAIARDIESEFARARAEAAGHIAVNISRSVRQGFARLDAHRAARASRAKDQEDR